MNPILIRIAAKEVLVPMLSVLIFLMLLGLRKTCAQWFADLITLLARTTVFGIHIFGWLAHALEKAVYWIGNELGRAAQATEKVVAGLLAGLAWSIEYVAYSAAHAAEATWDALYGLRHAIIPKLIHGLTWPWRELAHGAHVLSRLVARDLAVAEGTLARDFRYAERRAAAAYAAAVAALAHAFGVAIPGTLDWLDTTLGTWWGDTMRTLRRRLTRIEEALGAAVFAGLVLKVLARHLPWYRCANVNRVARKLCGFPVQALEALLGGAVDALIVTDLCLIARLVRKAATAVAPELRALGGVLDAALCGGEHQAPSDLPIAGVELPSVSAGLPLG